MSARERKTHYTVKTRRTDSITFCLDHLSDPAAKAKWLQYYEYEESLFNKLNEFVDALDRAIWHKDHDKESIGEDHCLLKINRNMGGTELANYLDTLKTWAVSNPPLNPLVEAPAMRRAHCIARHMKDIFDNNFKAAAAFYLKYRPEKRGQLSRLNHFDDPVNGAVRSTAELGPNYTPPDSAFFKGRYIAYVMEENEIAMSVQVVQKHQWQFHQWIFRSLQHIVNQLKNSKTSRGRLAMLLHQFARFPNHGILTRPVANMGATLGEHGFKRFDPLDPEATEHLPGNDFDLRLSNEAGWERLKKKNSAYAKKIMGPKAYLFFQSDEAGVVRDKRFLITCCPDKDFKQAAQALDTLTAAKTTSLKTDITAFQESLRAYCAQQWRRPSNRMRRHARSLLSSQRSTSNAGNNECIKYQFCNTYLGALKESLSQISDTHLTQGVSRQHFFLRAFMAIFQVKTQSRLYRLVEGHISQVADILEPEIIRPT